MQTFQMTVMNHSKIYILLVKKSKFLYLFCTTPQLQKFNSDDANEFCHSGTIGQQLRTPSPGDSRQDLGL